MSGNTGKREAPVTSLNAATTVVAGAWIDCRSAEDILCVLDVASVTSGGTAKVEGDTKPDGSGATWTIATVPITSDGQAVVAVDGGDVPAAIRWNLTARTDGTYTGTIQRRVV